MVLQSGAVNGTQFGNHCVVMWTGASAGAEMTNQTQKWLQMHILQMSLFIDNFNTTLC